MSEDERRDDNGIAADLVMVTGPRSDDGLGYEGGEPACFATLVCPECGAVTTEGHLPSCTLQSDAGQ